MGEPAKSPILRPGAAIRPPQRVEYRAGDVIAEKYQLVRMLGAGGMATVWVAQNQALDLHVAIKLIRADLASPGASSRLLQEARAGASIDHPAIIRVFDFGKTKSNDPFIVMELLDGESLADTLQRRSRVGAVKAVQMLLPIADALAVAHTKGVVHRDLKPDNIFLHRSESGRTQPKVLDFGIARLQRAIDQKLTAAGSVLGSPAYMSPEQARGVEDIDHRSDIWALCVVLYETITGTLPFEADNYNALLRAVVENEPVPTTDLAAGDAALWNILQKGLCKRREERWQSMRKLGAALAQWLLDCDLDEDMCGGKLRSMWMTSDSGEQLLVSMDSSPDGVRKSIPDDWFNDVRGSSEIPGAAFPPGEVASSCRLKQVPHRPVRTSGDGPMIDFRTTDATPGTLAPVDTHSRTGKTARFKLLAGAAIAGCVMLLVAGIALFRAKHSDLVAAGPIVSATQAAQDPLISATPAVSSPAQLGAPLAPVEVAPAAAPDAAVRSVRGTATKAPAGSAAGAKSSKPNATAPGDDLKLPY